MRYIDTTQLYLKASNWSGANLWENKTLKQDFRGCFFNKCWYTECPLSGQDVHIDHFRPKAKIVKFKTYPYNTTIAMKGYDWLANDYKNYRACCIYANRKTGSGGKSNYFPLKQGSPHAQNGNMNGEVAMLIDPLIQSDVELLSFLNNSIGCTSVDIYDQARVDVSKVIYNLVDSGLTAERLKKWNEVSRCIDRFLAGKIDKDAFKEDLKEASDRKSPYSAVSICCIKSRKSDIPEDIYNQLDLNL